MQQNSNRKRSIIAAAKPISAPASWSVLISYPGRRLPPFRSTASEREYDFHTGKKTTIVDNMPTDRTRATAEKKVRPLTIILRSSRAVIYVLQVRNCTLLLDGGDSRFLLDGGFLKKRELSGGDALHCSWWKEQEIFPLVNFESSCDTRSKEVSNIRQLLRYC